MRRIFWLFILLITSCGRFHFSSPTEQDGDWPAWGREPSGGRYSPLKQVNKQNVARLERAWTYRTGDLGKQEPAKWVFECTPLVAEGKLFLITPLSRAVALDPVTGKGIWSFDSHLDLKATGGLLSSRGVAYWKSGDQGRVFLPAQDGRIFSLDAKSGEPDPVFGQAGVVDLKERFGVGRELHLTSPPSIYGDLLIQGCSMPDGPVKIPHVPVIALNIRTGETVWKFNTVPQEGESGRETWEGDSWRNRGGANVWSVMSVDPARGMVFLPATSPTFDFYGADRRGDDLFANSVIALDAKTGKRLWHYQTVHHDLWDYDLPAQPVLVDLKLGGKKIPAVAQVGKTGFVYLLNRITGEPIFPIEERPVPPSDVPGEFASPTQPFPTKPPAFTTQGLTEDRLSNLDAATREFVLEEFRHYRSEGIFTPPSIRGSVNFPGFHGGANWSAAAFDPTTGRLYVNSTEMACLQTLFETPGGNFKYANRGYVRLRDQNGYPANAPPWGQLSAIDLNMGEIVWQKPLGEFDELTRRGIPPTGQENFGGPTVTAGGLVFIASTMDAKLRAYDKDSGKILLSAPLDSAGYAAPITYLGADGRQYVVICAGGGGKLNTPKGDAVVAFALPEKSK